MLIALVVSAIFAAEPLDTVVRELALPSPRHAGIYVVAHRGAHLGIPENTLAAYQKAIDLGCDFVEIDVRATKDAQLVSIHNSTVDAYTTGAEGPVRNFTLAQLKALDIGSRVGLQWREERVPTVEEIFRLCQGKIGVYLDVKEPAVIPALLALVRRYGFERRALWYTGLPQQKSIQKECPECLLMPDPGPEKNLQALFTELAPPPRIIASVMKFCTPSFVEFAHARGAIVITDEASAADWPAMRDSKMDGIQTDDPAGLIAFLRSPLPLSKSP